MPKQCCNLCFDIGNTRIKWALFREEEPITEGRCREAELEAELNQLFRDHDIQYLIVSTVRKSIPPAIHKLKGRLKQLLILDHKLPLPIKIDYDTPETLGRDRIAAAVGAHSLFPDMGCIVVDSGTCITYDYIDKNGAFLGGNIAPGMYMRLKAMDEFTANLPLPPFEQTEGILGKSTHHALQNGAIQGTIYEIDTFIREIQKNYGNSQLVVTGGDANYFVDYFKSKIFVVQNLVLIGLNKIIIHNA